MFKRRVTRSVFVLLLAGLAACSLFKSPGDKADTSSENLSGPTLAVIEGIERQPLVAQVERLITAMQYSGEPLPEADAAALREAFAMSDEPAAVKRIQEILDPHCLIEVHINPESRVKLARGPARAELHQQGWRAFLVKVHNEPGTTPHLSASSPNAQPVMYPEGNLLTPADVSDRWMQIATYDAQPMNKDLSGLKLEYRIVHIFSRDAGAREAKIMLDAGQGTQDIGFRNELSVLFQARRSVEVVLGVRDEFGEPSTASFIVKDEQGRIYPYAAKRLEPDFFFHDQVYRHDGESLTLPPGKYNFTVGRGPEYVSQKMEITVPDAEKHRVEFQLTRWIDPSTRQWYSGDHHVHAAGCMHYKSPTLGVEPPAMMRHILGEALNVGCVLTWGPAWYHQKQNFTGTTSPLSTDKFLMRYDVEVSGFPSDHCGHLVLLRLKEDDYPGTDEKQQWPTWTLPILQWAKKQGAVVGVAHSGWGLEVWPEKNLPNYVIPPMNGIGAQEYLVDVTYDAVDFISTVDTPYVYELNMWYHTLNCGFETKISGETDFPCIYGDKVGLGRSYVKVTDGPLDFDRWVAGVDAGRCYVSDGYSHLMDFTVNGVALGGPENSRVKLDAPGTVKIRCDVSAMLDADAKNVTLHMGGGLQLAESRVGLPMNHTAAMEPYNDNSKVPYWHVERARIAGSRRVPVEVVVNGLPVTRTEIEADGQIRAIEFDVPIERSSWVALRILPSAHTNAMVVEVGGKPVRASKKSAQWCLDSIDKLWTVKSPNIREKKERPEAEAAFMAAKTKYQQILEESFDDREVK